MASQRKTSKHFWKCKHHKRIEWHQTFLKDLKTHLVTARTGPKVQHLLISKLRAVLDGENPDRVPVNPVVTDISSDQTQIGWHQLMYGRFALQWDKHTNTQPAATAKQQGSWTTNVIDFIFSQWWKLWESRNQDRHGRDLTSRLQANALQVDRELALFYDTFITTTPQHLAWLFDTTLEVRRQCPPAAIRQWLNTWHPILTEITNLEWDPHHQENYPHQTELETG